MSFWNTFWRVWEVRTSFRIQQNIEQAVRNAQAEAELNSNLPDIIQELEEKNDNWNRKLKFHREIKDSRD
jgi:hypothetical protein